MRFRTSQAVFMEAFNRVYPAVPSKSTLPILSNVLFTLEGNRLRMVATDMEISVVTDIEVRGEEDGSLSIPAKKIGEIARELSDLEMECWVDDSYHMLIKAGEGEYQVPGISSQEFPQLPEFDQTSQINLDAGKFDSIITRTEFAVSKDELRPALTGVFFQLRTGELRAISTDGHRLVRIVDQSFEYAGEPSELIIPVKALRMIRKNLPAADKVELVLGKNQIMAKLDDATIYSRLIEGKYPHYESVIPQNNENRLVAYTNDLINAVKRAKIFANPINRQIVFKLEQDKIRITAEDVELGGQGSEAISARYDGETSQIGYNADYILEILKMVNTEEVRFDLGGSTQAGIVKPITQLEREDFLMIIMPVRLD